MKEKQLELNDMQIHLNETQMQLYLLAKRKGFLCFEDFFVYATNTTRRSNLMRFVACGILVDDGQVGRFKYNGKSDFDVKVAKAIVKKAEEEYGKR